MKNPLHYQLSEYDCGPTSLLNAISFLFEREDIPPEVIRSIMLYCLDRYNNEGTFGKRGTSRTAMMFLSNWLDGYGQIGQLPISSSFISGEKVFVGENSLISDAVRRGGAAVAMVYYECTHYVLLTGEKDDNMYMFDPYYQKDSFPDKDIIISDNHPFHYNRIVPAKYLNSETHDIYALGEKDKREAVLLFNEKIKLTPERTIEYFI